MKILVINGPNLNMLGKREREIYGDWDLDKIVKYSEEQVQDYGLNIELEWFQSNSEGEIIDKIHSMLGKQYDALIINPGAYSHYSLAILDALKVYKGPIAEVHLTNIFKREEYRHTLLTAQAATIIMLGPGKDVYFLAILNLYHKRKQGNVSNY